MRCVIADKVTWIFLLMTDAVQAECLLLKWRSCGFAVRHGRLSKACLILISDCVFRFHPYFIKYIQQCVCLINSGILKLSRGKPWQSHKYAFIIIIMYSFSFLRETNKQTKTTFPVIQGCRDESCVSASTEPFHQTTTKQSRTRSSSKYVSKYEPLVMSNWVVSE